MKKNMPRLIVAIFFLMASANLLHAQIVTDGTLGVPAKIKLEGPDYEISAKYGSLSGTNLFHSFQEFNIHPGESATFSGPNSVQNIITRVTGGNASLIDGILESAIPGANFYLLNSAGVMFGSGAALHLGGSFHVSTADYLRFGKEEYFHTIPRENDVLSISAPSAFGFLDSNVAPISIEGAGDITDIELRVAYSKEKYRYPLRDVDEPSGSLGISKYLSGSLRISKNQTVSVIGGDITIRQGTFYESAITGDMHLGEIRTPGGRINIAAVASAGEVVLKDDDLDVSSFQELGDISLSDKSLVDVAAEDGGDIFIRGGDFSISDSAIYAYSSENPGFISIKTDMLSLTAGSFVGSPSYQAGKGGDIRICASESVTLSGNDSEDGFPSRIETFAPSSDGGNVTIATKNLFLNDGAQINTTSLEGGTGGNISITSQNLALSNGASLFSESVNAGGGNITIKSDNLVQLTGSEITTSVTGGTDNAGDITISHPEVVTLNQSQLIAQAHGGDGGAIFIHTDHYLQSSDSKLDASSQRGNDGSVRIESLDTDISVALNVLPSSFLPDIRMESCSDRIGKNAARFVIAGRDGVPSPHDDFLPSPRLRSDISEAEIFCQKGDFGNAIRSLEQAMPLLSRETRTYMDALLCLTHACKATGQYQKALSALSEFLPVIENCDHADWKALFFDELGDVHLCLGDMKNAEAYLRKAVDAGRLAKNPHILGMALNNMGNFLAADGDDYGAMSAYQESLELFRTPTVLLNMLRLHVRNDRMMEAERIAEDAQASIEVLPDDYEKASYLISLSLLFSEFGWQKEKSYTLLDNAKQNAESLQDTRTASCACGHMAGLYANAERYTEAIRLTRQAVFYAQQTDSPEILYRWEWQLGKLFKAANDIENALDAYHKARQTLNPIRSEFFVGYRDKRDVFDERIRPVYTELAELLLEQSAVAKNEKLREEKLREARDTMEMLKIAELQDFFEDECVTVMQKKVPPINRTQPGTALIYPISLSDHLSLLLMLPDSMRRITVSVDSQKLRKWAGGFRNCLQNPSKRERQILFYAQPLYDWLIRPLESELSEYQIDTLVIAPDAALRLIPFSALYDGERFLIEKYAVATIPAIRLTDVSDDEPKNIRVMFNGLSEQAKPPLPGVMELSENIREIMGGGTFLLDKAFTLENISRKFDAEEYSTILMATHGVFGGSPQETYLQTSDGRLTMNDLESLIRSGRVRGRTADLLTLHACQTAMGDERAALGLGGIAVKAGVRSAVATLWSVTDKSAALAITEFYRHLSAGMPKAKALQAAQKMMLAEGRYGHPAYWAPFLLIGNWR